MSTALETPICAGCGAADATVLYARGSDLHAEEAFVATTDAFQGYGTVVTCTRCGLVRLSPRQQWEFLQSAYAQSEDPLYLDEYAGRLATARSLLRYAAPPGSGGRLLDIGCGAGILLDAARPHWEPHGVELSSWAVKEARSRGHVNIKEGTLEQAHYPNDTFDLVTLLDVIEHAHEPKRLFAEIRRILKPQGRVLVYTPDIRALVARIMGRWWWGLRPAHLYYFSRPTLADMLMKEGFEVVKSAHHGRRFTFGYWITRLRGYAPPFVDAASWLATVTRIGKIPLPLNTFDSIAMVGIKK